MTVEIGNTDAEGRLVLADAMSWTNKTHKPHTMIELSTLTGACKIALGLNTAGLLTNDESLANEIQKYGNLNQEGFWRLPILNDHREDIKSDVADLFTIGKSKYIFLNY